MTLKVLLRMNDNFINMIIPIKVIQVIMFKCPTIYSCESF